MLSQDKILALIKTNHDIIKKFGILRIGVFGSYVDGDPSPDSDVDILVEFNPSMKTFDNYMDLKFFLEDLFGTSVDLVIREAIKPALESYIMESVVYAT